MIGNDDGVLPRAIKHFINKIQGDATFKFSIAALQIYNEQVLFFFSIKKAYGFAWEK